MKLLLTSAGLSNLLLQNTFIEMVGKNPEDISIAFIDTASKVEADTSFVDKDLNLIRATGVKNISVINIAEPKQYWLEQMRTADVIWFEGGNTFYLLSEVRKTGLDTTLTEIIKNKVYVGVSAGTILVTPNIGIANVEPGDPNDVGLTDLRGLSLVNFEVSPHTPEYVSYSNVEAYAQIIPNDLYALDDQSAIKVIDSNFEIISEGEWKVYRK